MDIQNTDQSQNSDESKQVPLLSKENKPDSFFFEKPRIKQGTQIYKTNTNLFALDNSEQSLNSQQPMFIMRELIQMGFPSVQAHRLFQTHKITELNQAVQMLSKDPLNGNKYSHLFTDNDFDQSKCYICKEGIESHSQKNPNPLFGSKDFHIRNTIAVIEDSLYNQKDQNTHTNPQEEEDKKNQESFENQCEEEEGQIQQVKHHTDKDRMLPENIEQDQSDVEVIYCNICYCKMNKEGNLVIPKCNHQYCSSCVVQYLDNLIQNRLINKLVCPQYGCGTLLELNVLQQILTIDQLEKYQQFKSDLEIMKDASKGYCPNPKCNQVIKFNKNKNKKYQCEKCKFEFCGKCQISWAKHLNKKCEEVIAQEMGDWFLSSDFQNCPGCRVKTEKISGCNLITCRTCSCKWCWLCGAKCSYAHYLPFNPFGCSSLLYSPQKRCQIIFLMSMFLLFLPIVMLLPSIFMFTFLVMRGFLTINERLIRKYQHSKCCKCGFIQRFSIALLVMMQFMIAIGIGMAIAGVLVGLTILPAYIFQIYKLIKISVQSCCCRKKERNDFKVEEKHNIDNDTNA